MELQWMLSVVFVWLILRLLQTFSTTEKPKLYFKNGNSVFIKSILELCPIFTNVFQPTLLWGKSGHFQTLFHSTISRTKPKRPNSQRHHIKMPDGATMSYDQFEPHQDGVKAKFTLALCPGISNSSENVSLRTFAAHGQSHGYRVAILNHLGALKSETLTSPRIFSYGGTDEYSCMVDHLLTQYPYTKILAVGLSMGGNIITKYLGESEEHQRKVLCGISVCQGYEINESKDYLIQWTNLRRVYLFMMTWSMRLLLSRHRQLLFSEEAQKLYGPFNEERVFKATSLFDIDVHYNCLRAGHKCAIDYFKQHSSANYMHNIRIPMLFMNALDDPIIPNVLLKYPKAFVENANNCIFLTTKHGGHLGFVESGVLVPHHVTWLDRIIIEYSDAITSLFIRGDFPCMTGSKSLLEKDCPDRENNDGVRKRGPVQIDPNSTKSLEEKEVEDKEKRGSLKRGCLLQQATSYVQ